MSDNVVEIIIRAIDQASGTLNKIGASGGDLERKLVANWKAIGVAAAAAGAGLELLARQQNALSEATDKLSIASGLSSSDLRNMVTDVTGYGDSIKEVVNTMQLGAEQGLKSKQALMEYASYLDMVGDAAGENSDAIADSMIALEAYGISAENVTDTQGAFGYMLNKTTYGVGQFLDTAKKAAPALDKFDLSVDQLAIMLDLLEEKGYDGKQALKLINDAAGESSNITELTKNLGLVPGALNNASAATAPYKESLSALAEAHDENLTVIQKLTSAWNDMAYKAGDFIGQISGLAPALMLVGPALGGLKGLQDLMGPAGLAGVIPAITGMLGPAGLAGALAGIALPLAAAAAGVAALFLAYKTNFLGFKDTVDGSVTFISDRLGTFKQALSDAFKDNAPLIDETKKNWSDLIDEIDDGNDTLKTSTGLWDAIGAALDRFSQSAGTLAGKFQGMVIRDFNNFLTLIKETDQALDRLTDNPVNRWLEAADSAIGLYFKTWAAGFKETSPLFKEHKEEMKSASEEASAYAKGQAIVQTEMEKTGGSLSNVIPILRDLGLTWEEIDEIARASMDRTCQKCAETTIKIGQYVDNVKQTVISMRKDGGGVDLTWDPKANGGQGAWTQVYETSPGNYTQNAAKAGGTTGNAYSEAQWANMSEAQKNAVRAGGAYTIGNNKYNSNAGDGGSYTKAPDWSGSYTGPNASTPTGVAVKYLIADGSYRAVDTAGSSDLIITLSPAEWNALASQGVETISGGQMAGSGFFPGPSVPYVPPAAASPSIDTSTGGASKPILKTAGGFTTATRSTVTRRTISRLAKGGNVRQGGIVMVGDEGPELVNLGEGASVHPLKGGEGGGNLAKEIAAELVKALRGGGVIRDFHLHTPAYLGDKQSARALIRMLQDAQTADNGRKGVTG
jgi:hypothetical protein